MPKKELARAHTTVLGRVVYDRPRHFFGDRDLYRITRSMLVRAGDQPGSGNYDLDLGAWLATIILTLLRAVFEWVEKTHSLKNFLIGLIFKLLPGILKWALKYEDVYYRLLKSLWLWIGDILATGKPADKKEDTDNG